MVSRILALLVTALSIAFLGFAGVATFGGPNWGGIARSMKEYRFERSTGDNPQWTATAPDSASVGSSPVLPGAVVAALDDKIKKLKAQLDEFNASEPQLRAKVESLGTQVEADRKALTASLEQKQQALELLNQQYAQISGEVVKQVADGTAVEQVVGERRADIFRLTNQLELLRADEAQLAQIHRQMSDLIEQIDADLDKTRRRQEQLRGRLGQ